MKRPHHPPIVLVEWHDSRSLTSGWTDRAKLLDAAPRDYDELLVVAGFLLALTKHYAVISLGLAPNDDVMHTLQIPRHDIVRIRIVKPQRGGKWKKVK